MWHICGWACMYVTMYISECVVWLRSDYACIRFIAHLHKKADFWGFDTIIIFSLWELSVDSFNKVCSIREGGFNELIEINIWAVLFLIPLEKKTVTWEVCYQKVHRGYFLKYRRGVIIFIFFTHIWYIRIPNQSTKKLFVHKQKS